MSGQGQLGPLSNVLISDIIRHSCKSILQLSDIGINVTFTLSGVAVGNGVASVCVHAGHHVFVIWAGAQHR